jgi:membrane protein required for colicin V production
MNSLDLVLLAPLAIFAFLGFQRGFVKEALSIALTLFALLFAISSWTIIATPMAMFMDPETPGFGVVSGSVLFLLTLGLGAFIIYAFVRLVEKTVLSVPNRILGLMFGLLKGAVIMSIILQLSKPFGTPDSQSREASYLYPIVLNSGPAVYNAFMIVVPEAKTFAEKVATTIQELNGTEAQSR